MSKQNTALINSYINDFNPEEFTTDIDQFKKIDKKLQIKNAGKLKARIMRKRQIKLTITDFEFNNDIDASDVIVTQDQIDALLLKS